MQPYETEVRQFVIDNFLFGEGANGLSVQDSLLDQGLIDSTGILELVGFVQEKFGLTVEDEEIIPSNLDSICKVAQFIQRKKGEAVGPCSAGTRPDH